MNKIIVSGNLTRDTELKIVKDGLSVAKNSIAVNRPLSKNNEVDFFNIVAFGKTAEFLNKWFSKGSRVLIEGRLQTSNYTDKDGNKRTSFDIIIELLEFADSKKKAATNDGKSDVIDEDDMPF